MRAFAVSHRYLNTRSAHDSVQMLSEVALAKTPQNLTQQELKFARVAWSYFEHHTDPKTGFSAAAQGENTLGPWEMGATLMAIVCAQRLNLISARTAHEKLSACLQSIAALPTGRQQVPGLVYCHISLSPIGADGGPSEKLIGWSARQIMRLVAGFVVVAHHFPDMAPEISMILNRWNLGRLIDGSNFVSARSRPDGHLYTTHEEYLGYEQYAARVACLVGLEAQFGLDLRPILSGYTFGKHLLPGDKRQSDRLPFVITSEPFHLEAMEFGWRQDMLDVAASLFLAQKARFEQTGHLTAVSEDALDQPPDFAISGVLEGKAPFACMSRSGRDVSALRTLSTKAAFCWWALIPTPYGQKLLDGISELHTAKGWLAGIYETGGRVNAVHSLNTNAVILQALHYRAKGQLFCPAAPI